MKLRAMPAASFVPSALAFADYLATDDPSVCQRSMMRRA